jgi:hypothetical protein
MACQQVPVPAQYRLGAYQQPEPAENVPREPVQQDRQERPAGQREPRPGLTQLPLQDHDLVAQRQGFRLLVLVAHGKEPQ